MRFIAEAHDLREGHRLYELVLFILYLDERGGVEITHEEVARHDATKALHRLPTCSCVVCKLDAFFVFGKLSAVTEVEVEVRHDSAHTRLEIDFHSHAFAWCAPRQITTSRAIQISGRMCLISVGPADVVQ